LLLSWLLLSWLLLIVVVMGSHVMHATAAKPPLPSSLHRAKPQDLERAPLIGGNFKSSRQNENIEE
jgi:hypothetical protein